MGEIISVPKTSVVITTYNGEKYINELLDSILYQSVCADEVIIMDDGSTDQTVNIVSNYIQTNELSTWTLKINKKNLGWKKNFKMGFDLASGDLIFPCDQDDVWDLDKIRKMSVVMNDNAWINVLVTNYKILIEGESRLLGYNRIEKTMLNNNELLHIKFDEKWAYTKRPGCTFCFRKTFYEEICKSWDIKYAHDSILWRQAIIRNSLGLLQCPLIFFRRHGNNATSNIRLTRKEREDDCCKTRDSYMEFSTIAKKLNDYEKLSIIDEGIQFLNSRIDFLKKRSVLGWLKTQVKYNRHYLYRTSALRDLIYIIKHK